MATSTAKTYLRYKDPSGGEPTQFKILSPITNFPDMGSTPSKLDTTDLSAEKYKTSILGLQEAPELTFEANYDHTILNTINGLYGKKLNWELCFGDEEGTEGKHTWDGEVVAFVMGEGIDAVKKMSITISAETEITFA